VENPSQNVPRSRIAALFLLAAMLLCLGLMTLNRRAPGAVDVLDPQSASEWIARAETLDQAGDSPGAVLALRAALAREPWNPAAVRKITELLLRQEDDGALADWMEDLLLGDARLAEQNFLLPGFAAKREQPPFQALFREARIQARD